MKANMAIILTSVDDKGVAFYMAETLVELGLAACVQISGPGESVYRWEGEVKCEGEFYLSIKTSRMRFGEVISWLRENHPYEVPEIVLLDGEASPGYLAWLDEQTRHAT
jgi:periplasmic divalent cation tolerance protein